MIKAKDFSLFSRLYGLEQGTYLIRLWNPYKKTVIFDLVEVGENGTYFNYDVEHLQDCECIWIVDVRNLPVEYIEEEGILITLQNLKIGVVEDG